MVDNIINNDVKIVDENKVGETNENTETTDKKIESQEQQGEPISGLVNKELAKQLMEMGFSKNVSEKALFLNQQILEKSIEWIYENQDKPDFEEELRLVGKSE